jgi:2-polyprenyl-6-methoxyphenol hydroxylase-like FAD-dependent oxidoreductase
MKALIAGAGIAGLAAGVVLRRVGLEVAVFERSRVLGDVGAGLVLWPNGRRTLEALERRWASPWRPHRSRG